MKRTLALGLVGLGLGLVPATRADAYPARCETIVAELREQGATANVAHYLGRRVAWRESRCSPQYVRDHDDWSFSRFGLNGRTAGLRATWRRWCGADVRYDTRVLAVDVRCALEAYERMGARPWGGY